MPAIAIDEKKETTNLKDKGGWHIGGFGQWK